MASFDVYIDDKILRDFRKDDVFGPDPAKDSEALEKILILILSQTVRKDPDTIRELWAATNKVKVTKKS
jgi:hypothetical protein